MIETVILIPYRNRQKHLEHFLNNSWLLLKKHLPNSRLVILEQEEGKLFNRGKLLNVGFKEYSDKTEYFITHDVDLNPRESAIHLYKMKPIDNEIIGIYSSPVISLGGIIKISNHVIQRINGFPNNYWGWGVEDRALYNRAMHFDMNVRFNVFQNAINAKVMFKIFDDVNDRKQDNDFSYRTDFEYNKFDKLNKKAQYKHIMISGLNNLEYKVLLREKLQDDVELIKLAI